MPLMVCKKPNTYGGKKRRFGDEVEIHRNDVRLVTGLGWFVPQEAPPPAVKAPAPKAPKKAPPEDTPPVGDSPRAGATTDPAAPAAPMKTPDAADAPKPKRVYQRRDLTAEDS